MKQKRRNYINNRDLYESMKKHCGERKYAQENGLPVPEIPHYVVESLFLIATRLASKSSFSGYSYKDDMISDGILNCIEYGIKNFNPDKTENPFAYFTQIIKQAFIRRIEKEKKQQYIKIKNLQNSNILDEIDGYFGGNEVNHITDEFVVAYEKRLTERKKPAKVGNTITTFLNEEKK